MTLDTPRHSAEAAPLFSRTQCTRISTRSPCEIILEFTEIFSLLVCFLEQMVEMTVGTNLSI
jgi:hypothetical protein